jgi:3',5'-nucleoside bisphosphate phosphatase
MRVPLLNSLRLALCLVLALTLQAICPAAQPDVRHLIRFPDLPGYKTLACDLHMHTVFSDGNVWPTVRVAEAWRQGLDAIAITDHVEHHPHKADVPTKHNRPYELAEEFAKAHGILLIRGAEITRDTPPGHFNALFLSDVAPLDTPDLLEAVKRATGQGGFVFWNHHAWQGEKKGQWLDVHTTMFQNGWLRGMEVANGDTYYPQAHQWCLDKKLTMLGNSDIHDPDLRRESSSQDHRTMTLVFAKERSVAGIKEALEAGRTIVWIKDRLIGREELLSPFFAACVKIGKPIAGPKKGLAVEVRNNCQADLCLEPAGKGSPRQLVVPAGCAVLIKVPVTDAGAPATFDCTVKNFIVAPNRSLAVALKMPEQ